MALDSSHQALFVLQLVVALAPPAIYFLMMGLANSQAQPRVMRARVDFILLTTAFIPFIAAPVLALIQMGHVPIALAVLAGTASILALLMPPASGSWVVYNLDPARCRRILTRACERLGWTALEREDGVHVPSAGLLITLDAVPVLRNVTLRIQGDAGGCTAGSDERLMQAIRGELRRESLLPSPAGASLVVLGAALLGVPMWYVVQHFDAIVDVVRRILPA